MIRTWIPNWTQSCYLFIYFFFSKKRKKNTENSRYKIKYKRNKILQRIYIQRCQLFSYVHFVINKFYNKICAVLDT